MSKSVLYGWQRFIDDQPIHRYSPQQNSNQRGLNKLVSMLNEMQQKVIDVLKPEIESVENGGDNSFDDVFGKPEEGNPKTRMILPYGNRDIQKLKSLLIKIKKKLPENVVGNWNVDFENVEEKKKPLGWKEGDPIPTIQKTIGSLSLNTSFVNQNGKEITAKQSFGKLLQKYFPEEMTWWQGDKSKGISGKQTFFTNNPETTKDIATSLSKHSFTDQQEGDKSKVMIISRHPIDIVRMSDFSDIQSCHSQDSGYFQCAVAEAKRTMDGGAIIYSVDEEELLKRFPDGVLPQTGDLFDDEQRDITDMLSSEPFSRLRVRTIKDTNTGTVYAVPDRKIYGKQEEAFREGAFNFFAQQQMDKFVDNSDPNDPIIKLGEPENLVRYGGSYEDNGFPVYSNFSELIKTVIKQSGHSFENQKQDIQSFNLELAGSKIPWAGDEEKEEYWLQNRDICRDNEARFRGLIDYKNSRFKYFKSLSPPMIAYGKRTIEYDPADKEENPVPRSQYNFNCENDRVFLNTMYFVVQPAICIAKQHFLAKHSYEINSQIESFFRRNREIYDIGENLVFDGVSVILDIPTQEYIINIFYSATGPIDMDYYDNITSKQIADYEQTVSYHKYKEDLLRRMSSGSNPIIKITKTKLMSDLKGEILALNEKARKAFSITKQSEDQIFYTATIDLGELTLTKIGSETHTMNFMNMYKKYFISEYMKECRTDAQINFNDKDSEKFELSAVPRWLSPSQSNLLEPSVKIKFELSNSIDKEDFLHDMELIESISNKAQNMQAIGKALIARLTSPFMQESIKRSSIKLIKEGEARKITIWRKKN